MDASLFAVEAGCFTDSLAIALLLYSAFLWVVTVSDSIAVFVLSEDTVRDC